MSEGIPPEWADTPIIVGQRVCAPAPTGAFRRFCADRVAVFEVDDDLFDIPAGNPARAFFTQPEIRANLIGNAAAAALVTVSTPRLAEVMGAYNPNVAVLPNYVPAWLCDHVRPRAERLTLGWGGSATHAPDLAEIRDPLRQTLRRQPQAQVHLMGIDYRKHLRLPADQVVFTPGNQDLFAYWRAIDFDIGLAPLHMHPFNRAKSALRPMEYGALGIPVVASDYGEYADYVVDGVTGFLVKQPHEWAARLRDLICDAELREGMGAKAREHARGWTTEGNAWRWEQTYAGLR